MFGSSNNAFGPPDRPQLRRVAGALGEFARAARTYRRRAAAQRGRQATKQSLVAWLTELQNPGVNT